MSGKSKVAASKPLGVFHTLNMSQITQQQKGTLMAEKILEVRDVSKCYGGRGKKNHEASMTRALDHVNFYVEQGEYLAIMGPSGSGKSTLLNCIATIDTPTSGRIVVGGKDVTSLRSKDLAQFRREELGFVFQDSNLLDTLTIRENIALALTISHVSAKQIATQVESLAQRLNIETTLDRYPYEVSGGQKQRAAAARAVITKPHLMLADEPTGALDTKSARDLLDAFAFLNSLGTTILMVTHDSTVASYCERIVFIRDGKLWGQMRRGSSDRRSFHSRIVEATTRMEEGDSYDC